MPQTTNDPSDLVAQLQALRARVEALENRAPARRVTDASRPAPSELEGGLVYNVDVKRHQGSNGVNWYDLY